MKIYASSCSQKLWFEYLKGTNRQKCAYLSLLLLMDFFVYTFKWIDITNYICHINSEPPWRFLCSSSFNIPWQNQILMTNLSLYSFLALRNRSLTAFFVTYFFIKSIQTYVNHTLFEKKEQRLRKQRLDFIILFWKRKQNIPFISCPDISSVVVCLFTCNNDCMFLPINI